MKIGFVEPWDTCSPPNPGGSLGVWTWEVARRLARSHEVIVCGVLHPGTPPVEEADGVRFFRWPVRLDMRLMRLMRRIGGDAEISDVLCWYYSYLFLLRVALLLRSHRCDVIHIFNLSQFASNLARLNRQAAIVLNMHCDWLAGMDRSLIDKRLQFVDRIIGCADCITNDVRSRFPHYAARCDTIYGGVDVEAFHPPEAGSGTRASETLITVGRISPEKGLHVLLDAFERVLVRKPHTKLRIIGAESVLYLRGAITKAESSDRLRETFSIYGKNYLEKLKDRVKGSLRGNVSFIGALSHHEIAAEMRNAAILIQPSLYETFGMPAVEAMATGLPVVASGVGGLPEIVSDGETGFLVKPSDPAQLAQALMILLDDPVRTRAMAAAARYRALRMFSWEVTVDKLSLCYERANKRSSSRGSACRLYRHDGSAAEEKGLHG